ncbi:MAG: hypothetical protein PPP55_06435 [Halorubrum sp.]
MHDSIAALVRQEGWHAEGDAARVHYEGGADRYAVEYYAGADAVLYWTVPTDAGVGSKTDTNADTGTAEPVARASVPTPLRERIRQDLAAANVDPTVEGREI